MNCNEIWPRQRPNQMHKQDTRGGQRKKKRVHTNPQHTNWCYQCRSNTQSAAWAYHYEPKMKLSWLSTLINKCYNLLALFWHTCTKSSVLFHLLLIIVFGSLTALHKFQLNSSTHSSTFLARFNPGSNRCDDDCFVCVLPLFVHLHRDSLSCFPRTHLSNSIYNFIQWIPAPLTPARMETNHKTISLCWFCLSHTSNIETWLMFTSVAPCFYLIT